jgi:hypothetical protein
MMTFVNFYRSKKAVTSHRFWTFMTMILLLGSTAFLECRSSEAVGSLYVVAGEAALLRDYPAPDSGIVTRLHHQDQVEHLDSNASGWWKVRSLRTGTVGWMTADLLSPTVPAAPTATPGKQVSYYANSPFDLRTIPLFSASVSGRVKLNDRLEKVGSSPEGWTKVKNVQDGSGGWLPTRYLSPHFVSNFPPKAYTPKKRARRPLPVKKKKGEATAPTLDEAKPM